MLLYHFDSAEDLLRQVVFALRERRIGNALTAIAASLATLADRVRAAWESLRDEETQLRRVLDQAMGLAMYDPGRYAALGHGASQQYLPTLVSFCPAAWPEQRKHEVASMILATLRGFLVDLLTSSDGTGAAAGFAALLRAVEREERLLSLDSLEPRGSLLRGITGRPACRSSCPREPSSTPTRAGRARSSSSSTAC